MRRLSTATSAPSGAAPHTPVLVVGGGPVGFTLFLLLARLGVPPLLVERGTAPTRHPQAHFINCRTMEIFRLLGPDPGTSLERHILAEQPPLDQWRTFTYCTGMLRGTVIGRIDHFDPANGQLPPPDASPSEVAHYSQNRLMGLLWDEARRVCGAKGWHFGTLAGEVPRAGVVLGQAFEGLTDHGDAVEARFRAISSPGAANSIEGATDGFNAETTVTAGVLAACDGAHSAVRSALGIQVQGQPGLQHLINIHFRSPELGRRLLEADGGNRASMLYFVFNTRAIAVVVAHDLALGEFVAQVPYYPPHQRPEDFSEPRCRDLVLAAAFGSSSRPAELPDLTIETVRPWTMSALVAERYAAGRAALVGDAAHQFPPAGGFGMNTGVCDAHNLAWKLALHYHRRGELGEDGLRGLLRSYDAERRPAAKEGAALSLRNFNAAVAVPTSLGLDPRGASLLSSAASLVSRFAPAGAASALLDSAMGLARGLASDALLDENTALGRARLAAARGVLKGGKSLRLLFPRQDLGFVYGQPEGGEGGMDYVPKWEAGARCPHVEMQVVRGPEGVSSTVDLAAVGGKAELVALCRSEETVRTLRKAGWAVPVVAVRFLGEGEDAAGSEADVVAVAAGGLPAEAVLVRPDGHILAVSRGAGEGELGTLIEAVARYVGSQGSESGL
ncbi:FAD binding domain-containing protein [Hyaloraphidium curvatum]|nr:FAD binding domain-containing protein [Hyaloraphidium curvatum]